MTEIVDLGHMMPDQLEFKLQQTLKLMKSQQSYEAEPYIVDAIKLTAWLARTHRSLGNLARVEEYRTQIEHLLDLLAKALYVGQVEWRRGYFHYQIHEFEEARMCFARAEPHVRRLPDYWLDRGRAEYNTGRLLPALKSFEQAYTLARRMNGRVDEQHFRWLAKTNRWLGLPAAEARVLQDALLAAGRRPLEEATQHLVVERLARARLLAGNATGAVDAVDAHFAAATPTQQAELAALKTEALCVLGQEDEAFAYAHTTAKTLNAGGDRVLAALFAHTQRPASANRALREALLGAAALHDATLFFTDDPRTGTPKAGRAQSDADAAFTRPYRAARRAIAAGRADLATRFLIDAAELAMAQDASLALTHALRVLNTVAPERSETAELHAEAVNQYPDNGLILLHAGHHHLLRGNLVEALELLRRAAATGEDVEVVAAPLVAQTHGALGEDEEALQLFRALINRDWLEQSRQVIGAGVFTPAVQWAQRSGHLLWGLRWAKEWLERHARLVITYQESLPIHQAAGQCALALGEPEQAYQHFGYAAATYGAWLIQPDQAQLRLRDMARNNAMLALAAMLAGNPQDATIWLDTARAQAEDLDVVALVAALILGREGDVVSAHAALLQEERSVVWMQVARLLAGDCDAAGRPDLAQDLRRKADVVSGQVPSLEEVLGRLDEQATHLIEARREAEENGRYRVAARQVFEAMVEHSGLLPQDHAAYAALRDAALEGQPFDPEMVAEAVAAELTKRMRQARVSGDACKVLLGAEVWAALPEDVRELLSLAQDHLAYALAQESRDHGPALLYLAKTLEELLREQVARPLEVKVGRNELPWDTFSLGCAPQRLLGHTKRVNETYSRAVYEVLATLPAGTRAYLRGRWRDDAHALVNARNAWSHGRDVITPQEVAALLPNLVGAPGTSTLLGAALSLAAALRA